MAKPNQGASSHNVAEDTLQGRRRFIKSAAVAAAAGASIVLTGATAEAQKKPPAKAFVKRAPLNTTAAKLPGFDTMEVSILTRNAKRATKADLFALQKLYSANPGKTFTNVLKTFKAPSGVKLSLMDVQSLSKAFHLRHGRQHAAKGASVSCCCCTCSPCCSCCASVVTKPVVSRVA